MRVELPSRNKQEGNWGYGDNASRVVLVDVETDPRCICEAKPLKVLLVKIEGEWNLPTATVRPAESTDSAAYRALVEQTAIDLRHMGQIVKETVAKEYIENREVATSWFPNCLKLRVCDQATMTPPVSVTNWMITWNLHDFVKTYQARGSDRTARTAPDRTARTAPDSFGQQTAGQQTARQQAQPQRLATTLQRWEGRCWAVILNPPNNKSLN